ncbi:hypothetical protein J6590_063005 [Homalodisca vitripennis]|nr:hypothetical protein J6590_063005 [Homalodisca vitripennis]
MEIRLLLGIAELRHISHTVVIHCESDPPQRKVCTHQTMSHNQPTGKRDRSDRSAARQGLRARQSPGGKRDAEGLPVFNSTRTPKRTPQFAVGPSMPKSSAVIRVQAQSVNNVGALHRCRSGQKGTWRALAGVMMYPYACS